MRISKTTVKILSFLLCFSLFTTFIPYEVLAAQADQPKTVRVGFFEFEGYHMRDLSGVRSGYGYDILQYMAAYENWKLEYVGYDKSWEEMQKMLEAGEIDILTSAQKTPERQKKFGFSQQPMGVSSAILTVKAGNETYLMEDYNDWEGMRVGLLKGSSRNDSFERFARSHNFAYEKVYYESIEDMIAALNTGSEIDAIVSSNLRQTENEWILAQFDASPFYVMTQKEDRELLAEVNDAVDKLLTAMPEISSLLMDKHYTLMSDKNIAFTEDEKNIVENSREKPIRIGIFMSGEPVCYWDEESEQFRGVSVEVLRTVSNKTGLKFEYVIVDSKKNAPIEWLKQGSADLVAGILKTSNFLADTELILSESIIDDTIVMVGRKGDDFTENPQEKTIALMQGFQVAEEYAADNFKEHRIVKYNSVYDCFEAVAKGKADATVYLRLPASYELQDPHYENLEILTAHSQNMETCVAGLSKDQSTVIKIINKGLAMVGESERNAMMMKYTVLNPYKMTLSDIIYKFRIPLTIVAISLVIVIMGLCVLISLKRKNAKALKLAADTANEYRNLLQKTYDMTIENMPNYVAKWLFRDGDVFLMYANQKYLDFLEVTAEDAIGKSIVYGFSSKGKEGFIKSLYEFERDKKSILLTNKTRKANGDICWLRVQASFFEIQEGNSVYYGTLTDITELIEMQENLRISQEEYKIAAALSEHSILRFDIRNRSITVLSQGSSAFDFSHIVGTNPESIISDGFIAPTSEDSYRNLCADIIQGIDGERVSLQVIDQNGKRHWCDVEHNTTRDNEGKPATSIISLEDVTAQKQSEELFNISSAFLDSAKDAKKLLIMNLNTGIIEYENSGSYGILAKNSGSTPIKSAEALNIKDYVAGEDAEAYSRFFDHKRLLHEYREGNLEEKFEYRGIDESGEVRWTAVDSRKARDPYSGEIKAYFIFSDIHEDKTSKIDLMRRATIDALTGLLNRESFEAEICHMLEREEKNHYCCAVIMIDIDRFKSVNDTFGHDMGDDTLKGVAARLKKSFRDGDIVARFGGDEFIALLPDVSNIETVKKVCERVCSNIRFNPVGDLTISGSIGIAMYPKDGLDYGDLRRKADIAMYNAKETGGNRFVFYKDEECL